ncbi:MAG TPA: hypothetical protein VGB99_05780 [Acidobacteriota bacterium]
MATEHKEPILTEDQRAQKDRSKKAYRSPELVVYGDIHEITRTQNPSLTIDGITSYTEP